MSARGRGRLGAHWGARAQAEGTAGLSCCVYSSKMTRGIENPNLFCML